MRYIIYGAGAVGGTIAARLFQAKHDVIAIARGPHLRAIQTNGLTFQTPLESVTLPIRAESHPSELTFQSDDVVLLTMKTQHTTAALDELLPLAPPSLPIICVQNGVENERIAARRFANVYGMLIYLPATHLMPGVVQAQCAPVNGVLDGGKYPLGTDELSTKVCADIDAAGISSRAVENVMRWKYEKLIANLGNAIQAACGSSPEAKDVTKRTREEAIKCFRAAGIDWATEEEVIERRKSMPPLGTIAGTKRSGGSTWQSLERGQGSIETDYLNGEVTLLGKLHNIPTPLNAALQRIAARMVKDKLSPGSMSIEEIEHEVNAC